MSGPVVVTGAAGGVGSIAVQLAREAGCRVVGSGRPAHRDRVLAAGADAFLEKGADVEDLVAQIREACGA